ncbi:MAG: hypothetical protein R6V03_05795 [Kiritimatiellia bacterium]
MADLRALRAEVESIGSGMRSKAFGVADLEALKVKHPELLKRVPGDYSRALVFGFRLQKAVLRDIVDAPTPLYFQHYRQVNYQLDRIALAVGDYLQDKDFESLAIPASQTISRNPMTGHVSHRLLAHAAGIGFIGRHGLVVHPRYGAQMRYVSVLTDAPVEPDSPHRGDCGSCRACISACPAGAVKERKEEFDLEACYRQLSEFTRLPFIGQHVCGVCIKACSGMED